jgi:pseudo-rSAM protein
VLESTGEGEVRRLVRKLTARRSLLVARLHAADLKRRKVSRFVRGVRSRFMGDLIDTRHSSGRPIEMMPRVKVQKDFDRFRKMPDRSTGEDVLQYLCGLTLYIHGSCRQRCPGCRSYCMQFPFCTRERGEHIELEIEKLTALFEEVQASGLRHVDMLGGDVFSYARLEELAELLKSQSFETRLWVHFLNLQEQSGKLGLFQSHNAGLVILVTLPCDDARLQACLQRVDASKMEAQLCVVVRDEEDMKRAQRIMAFWGDRPLQLRPYYDGTNRGFFERNVFLEKRDILNARPASRDIHINSVFNRSAFGKLVVTSRGLIHANLNTRPLGRLGEDSICEVLAAEMKTGKNWRRIRSKMRPCRDCVYELLCPSLSNYEYVFRKNNLCNIE